MALKYKTYCAIPHLRTYEEAKRWHDIVPPIRRDPYGTRPVGRRDQKWFNIWMEGEDVHVGHGVTDHRQTLISYQPSGTITLHKPNRWNSASDNERREALLGIQVQTHQYDVWICCCWDDEGEHKSGWLPLNCNGERGWQPTDKPEALSVFKRDDNGQLVFLNYSYPVTHHINRPAMREKYAPFKEFVKFVEGVRGLDDDRRLRFSHETQIEFFGEEEYTDYFGNKKIIPKRIPSLWYGATVSEALQKFLAWAASDNNNDRMKAAITVAVNLDYPYKQPISAFMRDVLLRVYGEELLTTVQHKGGNLVTDKYKRFLFR